MEKKEGNKRYGEIGNGKSQKAKDRWDNIRKAGQK